MEPEKLFEILLMALLVIGFLLWGLYDSTRSLKDLTKDQEVEEMHKSSVVYKGYTSSRS